MLPEHCALLEVEPCPVPDEILGETYRVSAHGLEASLTNADATRRSLLDTLLRPARLCPSYACFNINSKDAAIVPMEG
jgi:hypothetical protein